MEMNMSTNDSGHVFSLDGSLSLDTSRWALIYMFSKDSPVSFLLSMRHLAGGKKTKQKTDRRRHDAMIVQNAASAAHWISHRAAHTRAVTNAAACALRLTLTWVQARRVAGVNSVHSGQVACWHSWTSRCGSMLCDEADERHTWNSAGQHGTENETRLMALLPDPLPDYTLQHGCPKDPLSYSICKYPQTRYRSNVIISFGRLVVFKWLLWNCQEMLGIHILFTALTSASPTHVSIAVVLGKICRLGLWKHITSHKVIQGYCYNFVLICFVFKVPFP